MPDSSAGPRTSSGASTEYIGTGPFKLAECRPDQYIRMVRFDDYKPLSGGPRGYGGGKTVYVDEVRWIPVPDAATRVAQMETGVPDAADDLNIDAYERLKQNPGVRPLPVKPYFSLMAIFNKKFGSEWRKSEEQFWNEFEQKASLDEAAIVK